VSFAGLALVVTGKPVQVVTDAIETLSAGASAETLREFTERGGRLATADEICG